MGLEGGHTSGKERAVVVFTARCGGHTNRRRKEIVATTVGRQSFDIEMSAMGPRLREARMRSGYRQKDVAEMIGVSERTMQSYEAGEVIPWHHGPKLSEIYGVPLAWLLDGDNALLEDDNTKLRDAVVLMAAELRALRVEVRAFSAMLDRVTTSA